MGGSASTEKPPTSTTDPAAPAAADPEAGGDDGGSLAASVALLKELPKTVAAAKDIVALKAFTADEAAHLLETDETKLCTTAVAKQLAEGEEVIASWPTLMCSEYNFQYERTVVLTSAALYRCERVEKKEGAEVTVETAINAKVALADITRVEGGHYGFVLKTRSEDPELGELFLYRWWYSFVATPPAERYERLYYMRTKDRVPVDAAVAAAVAIIDKAVSFVAPPAPPAAAVVVEERT